MNTESQSSTWRLVRVPAVVTVVVTIVRLVGELNHWSSVWFASDMGASVVGIVWLAPVFGVYFALKLVAGGRGPTSVWRAAAFTVLGVAIIMARAGIASVLHFFFTQFNPTFHARLVFIWSVLAVAALATLPGWPALFKTLVAYGYAARIPVAIIMFFAYRGHWGTHYDAVPSDFPAGMSLGSTWLWMGFFPQLIFWVGFTLVSGMLFGTVAGVAAGFLERPTRVTSSLRD